MPDESPERPFDQAKKILQEQILHNYPNPERVGCPGDAALKQLASAGLPPEDDPTWNHVTHCSPCYGEFLQFRAAFKTNGVRTRRQQRLIWVSAVATAVLVVIVMGLFYYRNGSSATPTKATGNGSNTMIAKVTRRPAYLDLGPVTFNRGSEDGKSGRHLTLPLGDLDLKVRLPVGSEDGQYEIQVLRQPGQAPIATGSGKAQLENHNEYLTMHIDLADAKPGDYYIAFRRGASAWTVLPVQLTN